MRRWHVQPALAQKLTWQQHNNAPVQNVFSHVTLFYRCHHKIWKHTTVELSTLQSDDSGNF